MTVLNAARLRAKKEGKAPDKKPSPAPGPLEKAAAADVPPAEAGSTPTSQGVSPEAASGPFHEEMASFALSEDPGDMPRGENRAPRAMAESPVESQAESTYSLFGQIFRFVDTETSIDNIKFLLQSWQSNYLPLLNAKANAKDVEALFRSAYNKMPGGPELAARLFRNQDLLLPEKLMVALIETNDYLFVPSPAGSNFHIACQGDSGRRELVNDLTSASEGERLRLIPYINAHPFVFAFYFAKGRGKELQLSLCNNASLAFQEIEDYLYDCPGHYIANIARRGDEFPSDPNSLQITYLGTGNQFFHSLAKPVRSREKAAYLRKHEDRYFSRGRPSFTVAQGSPLVHPAYLGSYEDFADYLLCLACYARKFDAIRFGDGSSEIRLSFSANSFLDEARKANTLDESNLSHLYLVIVYELGKAGFFKDEESLFEGYQRLLIRGRNLVTDIIRNETLASYERIVVETSLLDLKRIEENIARLERTGINDDSFKATVGSLLKCFADAGFSYARKQAD